MIQRIQTIYLLLVCLLMGGAVISPLVYFIGSNDVIVNLTSCGLYTPQLENVFSAVVLSVIGVLSSLLAFVSIFMYKKRKAQIKMVNVNSLVIVSFYVALAVYFYMVQGLGYKYDSPGYGALFPFIALVFNILAGGKIKADEKLVKSLDRIR